MDGWHFQHVENSSIQIRSIVLGVLQLKPRCIEFDLSYMFDKREIANNTVKSEIETRCLFSIT